MEKELGVTSPPSHCSTRNQALVLTYPTQQNGCAQGFIGLTLMKWQLVIKYYYSNKPCLQEGRGEWEGEISLSTQIQCVRFNHI